MEKKISQERMWLGACLSVPSPSLSLLLFSPHSLLADRKAVAAVTDLEEEPLKW